MDDVVVRFWENLVGRVTGPLSFRLILQPAIAIFLAIRADGAMRGRASRRTFSRFSCGPPIDHGLLPGAAGVANVRHGHTHRCRVPGDGPSLDLPERSAIRRVSPGPPSLSGRPKPHGPVRARPGRRLERSSHRCSAVCDSVRGVRLQADQHGPAKARLKPDPRNTDISKPLSRRPRLLPV